MIRDQHMIAEPDVLQRAIRSNSRFGAHQTLHFHEELDQPGPSFDFAHALCGKPLPHQVECVTMQAGSFQIPVDHEHAPALVVGGEQIREIGERHGAAGPALIRIKRYDLAESTCG